MNSQQNSKSQICLDKEVGNLVRMQCNSFLKNPPFQFVSLKSHITKLHKEH